jgi:hypothetical protein
LRVTGRLSATNSYGSDIYVDRPAIADASDLRRGEGRLSWAGPHEQRVRQSFEDRIRETLDDLVTFKAQLGEENREAIEGLLSMAVGNLDHVEALHSKWAAARWPLSRAHYAEECTREVDMGKVLGGGFDRCPTYSQHLERDADRDEIVRRYVDSAHAIRCAEYGMWRVVLYRRALEQWQRTPQGGGPSGLAPTPPKPKTPPVGGGLSFEAQPPGPPPPPTQPQPEQPGLPDFPPEIDGGALPPPPPPEPPPSLGEPAEGDQDPSPVGGGEGLDRVERTATFGIGALVLGGVATTAILGATIYGVVKARQPKAEKKARR